MTEEELIKELCKLLLIYRKKNKISLKELSKKVNLNIKFLNELERGLCPTQFSNYFKIARAIDVPYYELEKIIKTFLNT